MGPKAHSTLRTNSDNFEIIVRPQPITEVCIAIDEILQFVLFVVGDACWQLGYRFEGPRRLLWAELAV